MCAHTIVKQITVYDIERLPLPHGIKENLKSYALTNYSTLLRHPGGAPQQNNWSMGRTSLIPCGASFLY